jgi:thioredoxin
MEIYDNNKHDILSAINSGNAICIQFSAKWCGPCKRITPDIHKLAEENKTVNFYYVDVDDYGEIASKFSIAQLPTFMFFKGGNEATQRITGANLQIVKQIIQSIK